MGIRTDLLVTEEIAESSDLRATPFESGRAKRVETALSILEGKSKIVILNRLFARPTWRFSELKRAVPGISQRMLSQQLRLLEECELVKRTVHPQFPPRMEYELTEFGKRSVRR
jgi:DNA-binding HxlR family transcriptional regulator